MAKGGGTGSRNKKKNKETSVAAQNGSVNGPTEGESTMINKGQSKPISDTKLKNNKHRRLKEESPPHNHIEDEVKEEAKVPNKLQPTSEQLRLAQLTQDADSNRDPQRKNKISHLMDITDKSEDEVATALHDCGWDEARAIDLLLEGGGGLGSWEETGKKKKKKQDKENDREQNRDRENEDWDGDGFEPISSSRGGEDSRERSRGGGRSGAPRMRRGGGSNRDGDSWKNRESQENERNFDGMGGGGRGRGGGGRGGRSRGGPGARQRGGGRGGGPSRHYGGGGMGGGSGGVGGNMGMMGVSGSGAGGADAGAFGQMDTWNPVGEDGSNAGGTNSGVGGGRRGGGAGGKPGSGKDAFDNAGNWGDDFPAAEDWDNDEYTGSLSDTKVFTPSGGSSLHSKSAVGEQLNHAPNSAAPAAPGMGGSAAQVANNSLSGAAYGQPIDLSVLLANKPSSNGSAGGNSSGVVAPGGPSSHSAAAINQYNQAATQDLKSAIGIGVSSGPTGGSTTSGASPAAPAATSNVASKVGPAAGDVSALTAGYGANSSALAYSSGAGGAPQFSASTGANSSFGSTATNNSAFSPIKPAAVTNGAAAAATAKALPRARLPPPSKIPSSAVEMPGDSLSNLDVQFGGLDLQFGANGSSSSADSTGMVGGSGFDFTAGSNGTATSAPSLSAGGAGTSVVPSVSGTNVKDSLDPSANSKYNIPPATVGADKSAGGQGLPDYKSVASVKDVSQSLSNALSVAGIKPTSGPTATDPAVNYSSGSTGSGGPRSTSDSKSNTASSSSAFGAPQRSQGPQSQGPEQRSKDSLTGYNSGYSSYQQSGSTTGSSSSGQSSAKVSQYGSGSASSSYHHPSSGGSGGYDRQSSNSSAYSNTNGLGGGGGGGSSSASSSTGYGGNNSSGYSNSYSSSSSYTNHHHHHNPAPYSSYNNNSAGGNTYSSSVKPPGSSSSYSSGPTTVSHSQYVSNSSATSAASTGTDSSVNSSSVTSTTGGGSSSKYDTSSGSNFVTSTTNVNNTSNGSGLVMGLSNNTSSNRGTSNNNSTSNKMMANLPPSVASVIPQYLIGGAGAATTGFPTYLPPSLQQPMYGYGAGGPQLGGVAGQQQLEDLAALQRNSLAGLPQLVGSSAPAQPHNNTKGPSTGYYDPTSQFGSSGAGAGGAGGAGGTSGGAGTGAGGGTGSSLNNSRQESSFSGVSDTSASTFAAQTQPPLPPGYAYFYGGMAPQLHSAYGGTGVYPTAHPAIPVPTGAGPTTTSQFQKQGYGSSYNNYDSLSLGQSSSDYGKTNYGSQSGQGGKGSNTSSGAQWYGASGLW